MTVLRSYTGGQWRSPTGEGTPLRDAVTGEEVARISSDGIDMAAALEYGRSVGGPALRELTFHQRAALLKALASYLREHRDDLYALSGRTGATLGDSKFDVDGGIGVLASYASRGRRSLPNDTVYLDGDVEPLGRGGGFVAQHICTSLRGVAVQINAFNFPVWGPLEKLAPAFIAGVPSLIKPASQTAYLTERLVELIVASGILPRGSVQLICGGVGDLLDHLTEQDLVSFTGSASTAQRLRSHPAIVANAVRFNAEADSLNLSILGPDATAGTPEFELYVSQLVTEMTVKAGQKCTAIRRAFVPAAQLGAVAEAVRDRLADGHGRQPREPGRADGRAGQPAAARRGTPVAQGAARGGHPGVRRPRAGRGAGRRSRPRRVPWPVLLRADDPGRGRAARGGGVRPGVDAAAVRDHRAGRGAGRARPRQPRRLGGDRRQRVRP